MFVKQFILFIVLWRLLFILKMFVTKSVNKCSLGI